MNKRIAKKLKKRYWFNSYRKFKQKTKMLDKDYEEYLESLKRQKTDEEKCRDALLEEWISQL